MLKIQQGIIDRSEVHKFPLYRVPQNVASHGKGPSGYLNIHLYMLNVDVNPETKANE